jgi:calcium-binding protein CML
MFKEFDLDSNGYIDKEELKKGTKSLGLNFDDATIEQMLQDADKNKDGKIQLDEFISIMMSQ